MSELKLQATLTSSDVQALNDSCGIASREAVLLFLNAGLVKLNVNAAMLTSKEFCTVLTYKPSSFVAMVRDAVARTIATNEDGL